jgi:hypothetical protein
MVFHAKEYPDDTYFAKAEQAEKLYKACSRLQPCLKIH